MSDMTAGLRNHPEPRSPTRWPGLSRRVLPTSASAGQGHVGLSTAASALQPGPSVLAREDRTAYVTDMPRARTGFDKYLRGRMRDQEFASAYNEARAEIDAIDRLMRRIDAARTRAGLSKADLARRASAPQESVRRLLTAKKSNPTLQTVVRLAQAGSAALSREPTRASGNRYRPHS